MNTHQEPDDPPIVYLRTGILIRDPARAGSETTPFAREWGPTVYLSLLAALLGCFLSQFLP